MDVSSVLHMNFGDGDTSYAKNSEEQRMLIRKTKPLVEEAISHLCSDTMPSLLTVADLGCSVGVNSLQAVTMVLDAVYQCCRRSNCMPPELQFFLNDLPVNDFNAVFKSLPSFHQKLMEEKGDEYRPCFVSATPGSFHDRLFPSRNLHFIYSACSLHWLSQVPQLLRTDGRMANLNKGKIALGRTSPLCVYEAYLEQFQRDFKAFLESRSQEMMLGGRMVLTLFSRNSPNYTSKKCSYFWESLEQAIGLALRESAIEEAKFAPFNLPYYEPHSEELRQVIQEEGSFDIIRLEGFNLTLDDYKENGLSINPKSFTNSTRAATESMIVSHFGEEIADNIYKKLEEIILNETREDDEVEASFLYVSLTRKY